MVMCFTGSLSVLLHQRMLKKTFALGSEPVWSQLLGPGQAVTGNGPLSHNSCVPLGFYEALQRVRGWRHSRWLLGIHPEFTAFSTRSKGNLCDAPFVQVLGIKNRPGHLHWALPRRHHHQTSELWPVGFFWDTKKLVPKRTPAAMPTTTWGWLPSPAAACSTPSSGCRAEPLV